MTQDHQENKNNITYWKIKEVYLKAIQTGWDEKVLLVTQSCPTDCDPMDCNPSGSCVHGILQARITWVDSHSLLQRIFPTQGSNPGLLHCRRILYHLGHQGKPGNRGRKTCGCFLPKILKPFKETMVQSKLIKLQSNGQDKNGSQSNPPPKKKKKPMTDLYYQVLVQHQIQFFHKALHMMFLLKKNFIYLALALLPLYFHFQAARILENATIINDTFNITKQENLVF